LTQNDDIDDVNLNLYGPDIYANDDTERALKTDLVIQNAVKFYKTNTDVLIHHLLLRLRKEKYFGQNYSMLTKNGVSC
jgi:hypothetical protein